MIIEIVKDSNKRYCACCRKRINKGDIIVKYDAVVDSWNNTRKWFSHIDCVIDKLNKAKKQYADAYKKAEEAKKKIMNINFNIPRYM